MYTSVSKKVVPQNLSIATMSIDSDSLSLLYFASQSSFSKKEKEKGSMSTRVCAVSFHHAGCFNQTP